MPLDLLAEVVSFPPRACRNGGSPRPAKRWAQQAQNNSKEPSQWHRETNLIERLGHQSQPVLPVVQRDNPIDPPKPQVVRPRCPAPLCHVPLSWPRSKESEPKTDAVNESPAVPEPSPDPKTAITHQIPTYPVTRFHQEINRAQAVSKPLHSQRISTVYIRLSPPFGMETSNSFGGRQEKALKKS